MVRKVLLSIFFLFSACVLYAQAVRVARIIMPVSDLEGSLSFFEKAFDAKKVQVFESYDSRNDSLEGTFNSYYRSAVVRIGKDRVELREYISLEGRSYPLDFTSSDRRFQHLAIVVSDMEKAYSRLKKMGVKQVSNQPQTIPYSNPVAGGVKALYFKDPDRHILELIFYPLDKRKDKWKSQKSLFLGIDHTAIVVSSTRVSKIFYEKLLGFKVKGESFNYGKEQEHLNGVKDSKVRITGLGTDEQSVGVEFLEYVSPVQMEISRQPKPRTYDIWALQTVIEVESLDALYKSMHYQYVPVVSKGIIQYGQEKKLLVKDPDGHFILLKEK
ncbi:MAG: VOC family protein [Cytophagales bacterium]|nr:VOC family protein [Cytophagales bacterium]